ncbi:MAG: DUF2066 domain-containing protein [Pseudomonadales bacterium]
MPAFKFFAAILMVLLWTIPSVLAVEMDDLYVAEVLVPVDSENQLYRGAREGLMEVLIRVSGTTAVENTQSLRAALANAENYYYQYSFDSTDATVEVEEEEVPARLLRIHFEPSGIAKLLRDNGFPVWGSNRPTLMVWIAADDGIGRRLVAENDSSELSEALERQAQRRGLPLLYPLLDLEDESNLSTGAVWGFFLGRIVEASRRYDPDSILTGRVMRRDDDSWSAHWSWRIDQQWVSIDNTSPDVDSLVAHVVDRMADDLVSRYAIGSSKARVWMRIDGVEGLTDYVRISRYISELMPVVDNQLTEVDGTELLFQLDIEGQSNQLVEIIELDKKMALMNPGAVDQQRTLRYRWVGE